MALATSPTDGATSAGAQVSASQDGGKNVFKCGDTHPPPPSKGVSHCYVDCSLGRVDEEAGRILACAHCCRWFHLTCCGIHRKTNIYFLWVCKDCQDFPSALKSKLAAFEKKLTAALSRIQSLETENKSLRQMVHSASQETVPPQPGATSDSTDDGTLGSSTRTTDDNPLPPTPSQGTSTQASASWSHVVRKTTAKRATAPQRRLRHVTGVASTPSNVGLQAAPALTTIYVSRLHTSLTPGALEDYINGLGITPYGLRLLALQRHGFKTGFFDVTETDVHPALDPLNWPEGIVVALSKRSASKRGPALWE